MDNPPRDGIVRRTTLTDAERTAAQALIVACNQHDGLELPLALERGRDPDLPWLLLYRDGDLAGLALLSDYGGVEAWLIVHPDHRRHGLGRWLLRVVQEATGGRLLLTCDEASAPGQAFASAVGAGYRFSEHKMAYRPDAPRTPAAARVQVRRAGPGDGDTLIQLTAASFGDDETVVRSLIETWLSSEAQRFYLAELDGTPVGAIRAQFGSEAVYLATFGVLPEHRRRGLGRATLSFVVDDLLAEGSSGIFLEVETDNRDALGLYESCGFRTVRTYHYYATS